MKDSGEHRKRPDGRTTAATFLRARPHVNRAMKLDRRSDGTALATVPMRKPRYLVPPLSWILPFSSHRRVELDAVGAGVLDLCDGKRTVEGVIETFAAERKLTFRESQLAVGQFLRQLAQRGMVAIVGLNEDADKP